MRKAQPIWSIYPKNRSAPVKRPLLGLSTLQPTTLALLLDQALPKGDVLATARIAGIQAAKRTSDLIPLCHPLPLTKVSIELVPTEQPHCGIAITAICRTTGQTGVEMEALTAVSVDRALTLYDMCKAVDKEMVIDQITLKQKSGGKA
jgi:cyclic pyranopterin phosphate synthase